MKNFFLTISLCFFIIAQFTFAQIPQTMSYQGVLTDANGNPVANGSYSLTFKLYDVPANGDSLWQETQNVLVTSGLFNVILGSVVPLNLPFDKQYWLGITIGNDAELSPRTALTASPYSLNSYSTLVEPQPGQGLTIRDSGGDATHQLDANGDVTHYGIGKFLGGIVVGDTIIVPVDTGIVRTVNSELAQKKNYEMSKILDEIGLSAAGSNIGLVGQGGTVGVQGQTIQGIGVFGFSERFTGVRGRSVSGTGVDGYSVSLNGVHGTSQTGTGVIGSSTSSVGVYGISVSKEGVFGLSSSGIGVFGGSETGPAIVGFGDPAGWFQGRLKLDVVPTAPEQARFLVWDNDNVVKYRSLPVTAEFDGVLQDKALIVKSGDVEVFRVDTDGTSLHKGLETYLAGIDLPDNNTENTTGNVKAGKFNGGLSNLPALNKQKFPSIVEVPNLETGTISFNPAVDNEPTIWGYTERTTGASVFGQNTNTTNTYPAVWGANFGGGAGVVGEVRNTSSSYPGMWAITYGTGTAFLIDHQGSAGNIFLGRSAGTNRARIDKTGKGFFNGGTQTGGADLAEAIEVEEAVEMYEPGDVMVISIINDRTITKCNGPYSTLVAGVYATKPGVLLTERNIDDPHDDTVPLGVVGIIPTKVCGENGSIHRGDLLVTSSIAGHAMKGTDRDRLVGAVIGKAFENFDGSGTGIIKVLVNAK